MGKGSIFTTTRKMDKRRERKAPEKEQKTIKMADIEPKQLTFRFPESGEQMELEFDDPSTESLNDAVGSLKKTLEEGLGLEGNKDSWLRKLLKQSKKGKGVGGGDDEPTGPKSRSGFKGTQISVLSLFIQEQ